MGLVGAWVCPSRCMLDAMSSQAHWWRMWRATANSMRQMLFRDRIRLGAMVVTGVVIWSLITGLALGMLWFLNQSDYVALKGRLVESVLALFFLALFFFVTASDAVLVWATLFRTRSGAFQAALPVTDRDLWWTAVVEGGFWAAWAVVVLAIPLFVALATDARAPLPFIAACGIATCGFLACCLALGGVGALVLARILPFVQRHLRLLGTLAVVVVAAGIVQFLRGLGHQEPLQLLSDAMGRLSFAQSTYLPSHWAQQAVSDAQGGRWGGWGENVFLLWTSAGVVALCGEAMAHWRLRRDLDALSGRPSSRVVQMISKPWRLPWGLPDDLGLLIAKDLRLFIRDPVQLLQFGSFAGLLGFYVLMLPRLGHAFTEFTWWRPVVSVLNMVAVTMALATFTGRFVYPLLALEGRRLWVLALAPWPRQRIVTAKFLFALAIGTPVALGLVVASGTLLHLPLAQVAYQSVVILCLAVGLTTQSLGLGARLADYGEDNPAKLVAGYGGTINLLASLGYSALIIGGAGVPVLTAGGPAAWIGALAWTLGVSGLWSAVSIGLARRWFGELDRTAA